MSGIGDASREQREAAQSTNRSARRRRGPAGALGVVLANPDREAIAEGEGVGADVGAEGGGAGAHFGSLKVKMQLLFDFATH